MHLLIPMQWTPIQYPPTKKISLYQYKMDRPYSLCELLDLLNDVYTKHRLSDNIVTHTPCMHRYRVKKGGRKEQYIHENGSTLDDQTCSVCFKIRTFGNAPENLLMDDENSVVITKQRVFDTDTFYRWLYRHDY
jgi:hypothetical protein